MVNLVRDFIGLAGPNEDITNPDGSINMTNARRYVEQNFDVVQGFFPDRAVGIHVAQARATTIQGQYGVGELGAGGEITYGAGFSYGQGFFNRGRLQVDATASLAGVANGGVILPTIPDFDLEHERVVEASILLGDIEKLNGVSVSLEFGITINGITVGAGVTVPYAERTAVVENINKNIIGKNFNSLSGNFAGVLSETFPDGTLFTLKGGSVRGGGTGISVGAEVSLTALASTPAEALANVIRQLEEINDQCFLADTLIALPNRQSKPISEITIGDVVQSYDRSGALCPGRVTRTFQKDVEHVLDFFGTGITPGHVTLCGAGKFAGQHVPIMDILRSDGAIVKEDGSLVRAATGCEVGSEGDLFVATITGERLADGRYQIETVGQVRAGTRFRNGDGIDVSVLELIKANGGQLMEDGMIVQAESETPMPFVWTFGSQLPKPEDYVLSRSGFSLAELYEANEWEGGGPRLPHPDAQSQIFQN